MLCKENAQTLSVTERGSSACYIHVDVPLVGGGVEEAPAGCVLGRHHTTLQTTQHGHHIVLDGSCDREALQKLRPEAAEQRRV